MEKFRRFLHPVWTGFVLLIAAYVLRGVFLCARDTFLYNRLDLCDPADFKIYHRNTEPKRWRSQVHTYRLYGTLYPEIRNADMRVGYDAYSRYAIGDTIRVYATSSGRVVPVSTVEKMRIWHIGSRGLASEHLPELFGLIGGGHNIFCRKTSSWNPSASRSHSFLIPVSENPAWRKSARLAAFPASTLHHNWCRCSISRA